MKKKQSETFESGTGILLRKVTMVLIFLVFSFSPGIGSILEKPYIKAGIAKTVISSKTPRIMANGKTSEGILHDIYARVLVLNDGVSRLIFVTYDLNCLDVGTPILRKRVMDELNVDPANLILLATHNHLAPLNSLPVNFDYGRELADIIFNLIKVAIDNEKGPVTLNYGFGQGYFVKSSKEPTDYEIQVLKVIYKNKPLAILFNQPTHPVRATGTQIDPGHPGYAMDELEKHYPGMLALYGDACGGNQSGQDVRNMNYSGTVERTKSFGHLLAQQVINISEAPMEDITGPFHSKLDRVSLPLAPPIPYEEVLELAKGFPKGLGFFPHSTYGPASTNWVRMMLHYYEKNLPFPKRTDEMICTHDAYLINKLDTEYLKKYASSINNDYPCIFEEVIVSRIGKMAFVAMQGEVCAPIGMRIKDGLRMSMPIMVFSYMGEQNLYIPTREIVRNNAYQAEMIHSQFSSPVSWAPEVEDEMVNAVIQMTKTLMNDTQTK